MLKITVASGKGGTGKTTVAVNLSVLRAEQGQDVTYVDCDVEAPNGHLFLNPRIDRKNTFSVLIPEVDNKKCDGCGECGEICQFSAIVVVNKVVLTFPDMCHSCGGCFYVCPRDAISEIPHPLGTISHGWADKIRYIGGSLNIGEAMATPLIRAVKAEALSSDLVLIDSPPGTACPVVETVRDSDFTILVTEPTPFGLNDLILAVETVRSLGVPFGVVINRCDSGDNRVAEYCQQEDIPVLASIPDLREAAEAYSRGEMLIHTSVRIRKVFQELSDDLEHRLSKMVVKS